MNSKDEDENKSSDENWTSQQIGPYLKKFNSNSQQEFSPELRGRSNPNTKNTEIKIHEDEEDDEEKPTIIKIKKVENPNMLFDSPVAKDSDKLEAEEEENVKK